MKIRSIEPKDLGKLEEIHARYFAEEFDFPDFFRNFLCVFTVCDNDENIITCGGVRSIAESIIITDKSCSIRTKREALNNMLQAHQFVAAHHGYDGLHAFIQDSKWKEHLINIGFQDTKGQSIVLPL